VSPSGARTWLCPEQSKRHMYARLCPTPKQEPKSHACLALRQDSNATYVLQAATQTPHVPA